MVNTKVRVKHCNLPSLNLDKLRQLRALNNGKNGLMYEPIRKIIAYKMGKAMPLSIVKKMHESLIAYIEIDDEIVSWGLLLSEVRTILSNRCIKEGVQSTQVLFEIHLYTKEDYRCQGLATKIAKSVKRKYPKTKFFGYWDETSIFCKNNLVKLQSKEKERMIKQKYRNRNKS